MAGPFVLVHATARARALEAVRTAPDGYVVRISEPSRTLEQNAAQWPILEALSDQREWPVNGQMVKLSDEEWKDVLTAAFEQDTVRLAAGLNGGVVMLGRRTSKYGKKKFSNWIEFLHAAAVELGVVVYEDERA